MLLARYRWNAELSECLYGPLQVLEVLFRNSLDAPIGVNVKNSDWLTSVPLWVPQEMQDNVRKAHERLSKTTGITHARMVQEMSFGFWTSMLNSKFEVMFHKIGAAVFPGMPRSIRTRANASARFEMIRSLRNRIFHFRRIWNRPDLRKEATELLEAIDWVRPGMRHLLVRECRFFEVHSGGPKM